MNALTINRLAKTFGATTVLKEVSSSFTAGQVTAIVGDNGAGKSTLLKIMAGVHRPDKGSITLDERNLVGLTVAGHRAMGIEMVHQDLALARQQDVVANLFMGKEIPLTPFGFINRKAMTQRAREALGKIQIDFPDMATPVRLLSGGQQQAVAIARALLYAPKVLLLDEPTAALAAREVRQILDLLRNQREQGRIIVFVSHRLNDVFAVADRILVMKQGQIVADTPTAATSLNQVVERIVG